MYCTCGLLDRFIGYVNPTRNNGLADEVSRIRTDYLLYVLYKWIVGRQSHISLFPIVE